MGLCFAYDPAGPRLYTLNTTAWLVLTLCAATSRAAIVAGFHREVEPLLTLPEAAAQVDEALADLLAKKLIEPTGSAE